MQRLAFLDSLRGLAALYVLVYHLALVPSLPLGEMPAWTQRLILFGGTGVILFFVISAYCLCLTMPGDAVVGATVRGFYIKRLLRIAPLFYAACALNLVHRYLLRGELPDFQDVVANATFTFNFLPGQQDSLAWAGWTIGVEMLFYAVFPALHVALRGLASKLCGVLLAILAYRGLLVLLAASALPEPLKERYALLSVVHYLPVFLMGMIAFEGSALLRSRAAHGPIGPVLLIAGAGAFAFGLGVASPLQMGAVYTVLLLGLAACPLRLVVNRVTRFVGLISYSVYLLHGPIIYALIPLYRRIYAAPALASAPFLACLGATLAVVIPCAWLSYRFVERPAIRWAHRLTSDQARVAPVAVPAG